MNWSKLKVTELKAELKRRGLPQSGLKAELVARVEDAEDAEAEEPEAPADSAPEPEEQAPPEALPGANGDAGATDQPSAEFNGHLTDDGEGAKDAEMTGAIQTDDDVAHEGEDEAQRILPEPSPSAEPLSQPAPQQEAKSVTESVTVTGTETETVTEMETMTETETVPEPEVAPAAAAEPEHPVQAQDIASGPAPTPPNDTEMDVALKTAPAPSSPKQDEETLDVAQDIQKRKRSPSSPPADLAARKRQRGGSEEDLATGPALELDESREIIHKGQDTAMADRPLISSPRDGAYEAAGKIPALEDHGGAAPLVDTEAFAQPAHPTTVESRHFPGIEPSRLTAQEGDQEMDFERDVEPAVHPATSALYIRNFMRPLRAPDVRAHLVHLAHQPGAELSDDGLEDFFLDQIRTHAFAVFKNISTASRVRTALHSRVWPDEANRKPLWVDFVPAEKVREWIETEEAQGGSRSSTAKRWAVTYDDDNGSGDIVARLELDDAPNRVPTGPSNRAPPPPIARPPPRGPAFESTNMIPIGPRAQRGFEAPHSRANIGPGRGGPPGQPGGKFGTTTSRPHVTYRLVSDELAHHRLDDMQSYYTKDSRRDHGKEINRYTFEDSSRFVDRGTEVFEGIRPPHRERERQFERQGRGGGRGGGGGGGGGRDWGRGGPRFGGRGPPPFQPRSDRYLPGVTDRDDRRWQDDSPPRHHRGNRGGGDYRKDAGRLHFEDDRDGSHDHKNARDGRY